MARWWNEFPKSRPRRPAKDGIQARSRKGDIGERWWSKRFVAALEAISDPGRLNRGRSYARTGQVTRLGVEAGAASARVQGSRAKPYEVRIAVQPFSEAQWERVEAAMADQALFMAALLAGEMPREIEQAFAAAGLSLFPARPEELKTSCSCPDWANPCKHVAATLYILAERFDDDPFLIFAWRGRTRDRLTERLRARRAESIPADAPAGDAPAGAPEEPPGAEGAPPLAASLDDFWRAGPELATLQLSPRAADVPDALLRQLGPVSLATPGRDLAERLAPAYRAFAKAAEERALGEG